MENATMWHSMPDMQYTYIKQQQSRSIAEAAADHMASRRHAAESLRFTGLRLRFGTFLIVVGRTLCEDDVLAVRPSH
jgi:hypothetical protein